MPVLNSESEEYRMRVMGPWDEGTALRTILPRSSRASRAVSRPLRSGRSGSLPGARLAKKDPSRWKLGLSCAERRGFGRNVQVTALRRASRGCGF